MSFECLETWSKNCSNMRSKQNTSKELNIRPWSSWLLFLPHSRNLNINCGSSLDETNCRKYMTTPVPWLVYITIEWHGWIPIIVIPLPGIIQKPVLIVGFHMCDVKIHIFDQPKSKNISLLLTPHFASLNMVKPSVSFRFFMFSLSESSGIQPGGRPHATRWTRPSWRRTKAEPGPCYREPPSLVSLVMGELCGLKMSQVSDFFWDFICVYAWLCANPLWLSLSCTLNLSIGSIGSSSQLMEKKGNFPLHDYQSIVVIH